MTARRYWFDLFIVMLACGWLSSFAQPAHATASDAVRYYEDALTRFNGKDYKGALIQLKNTLRHDPTQLPAKVLLGKTLLALGNASAAEAELLKARQLGADRVNIEVPLARVRNLLGKFEQNIEEIRPTGLPKEVLADLWVELGRARLATQDPVGAEIAFHGALKAVPLHAGAMLGMASVKIHRERLAEAEDLVGQALQTHQDNADLWQLLGRIRALRNELDGARQALDAALTIDPDHLEANIDLAKIEIKQRRFLQAAERLGRAVQQNPASVEAHFLRYQALRQAGETEQAGESLASASAIVDLAKPADLIQSSQALRLAALIKYENRQYEAAYSFLEPYVRREADDIDIRLLFARLLIRLDKPVDAVSELNSLRNQHPNNASIHILLGDAQNLLRDYTGAEQSYRQALAIAMPTTHLIARLGLVQDRQGRGDLAIETLSQLVEVAPEASAGASLFLGILHLQRGELQQAADVADRLIAWQPENLLAQNLQAAIAIARGEVAEARRLLEHIVRVDADFLPAQINLSRLDTAERRFEAADHRLTALAARYPDDAPLAISYADLALARGQAETAVGHLEDFLGRQPSAAQVAIKLADIHQANGRNAQALAVLLEAEKTATDDFPIKLRLAATRLGNGDIDSARALLLDAASLAGPNPHQRLAVTRLQIVAGAYDDAEQRLQRLMLEHPGLAEPRIQLGHLYGRRQQFGRARELMVETVRQHPDSNAAVTLLADILMAQGRADDAAGLYRQVLDRADDEAVAISLYRALRAAGHGERALDSLTLWQKDHPQGMRALRLIADHHAGNGDRQQALALYDRLLAANPGDAEVHNNRANLLLPIDSERALQAALRAYELDPQSAGILDTLGWMQVQLGDLDNGLARLREAAARNGRVPTIRYHLAVALEEYGNRSAAKAELRRALALAGPFPERESAERRLRRLEAISQ